MVFISMLIKLDSSSVRAEVVLCRPRTLCRCCPCPSLVGWVIKLYRHPHCTVDTDTLSCPSHSAHNPHTPWSAGDDTVKRKPDRCYHCCSGLSYVHWRRDGRCPTGSLDGCHDWSSIGGLGRACRVASTVQQGRGVDAPFPVKSCKSVAPPSLVQG